MLRSFVIQILCILFKPKHLNPKFGLLNNLTQKFGSSFEKNGHINYSFPEPCVIMKCTIKELMALGFSQHKVKL